MALCKHVGTGVYVACLPVDLDGDHHHDLGLSKSSAAAAAIFYF